MGEKSTWHNRFSVGESFVMTGIAHFFHLLAPHRLQLFVSFGKLCALIKSLWPRRPPHGDQCALRQLRQACRISLRGNTLAPHPVVEAPSLAEQYMRSQQCWFRRHVLGHSWGPKSLFNCGAALAHCSADTALTRSGGPCQKSCSRN